MLGAAAGAIMQGWLSDALGRKRAMFWASIVSLIGGILGASSANIAMLISARFLQALGLGQIMALVPLYIIEVAPSHQRGLLGGLTAISLALGYLVYVTSTLQLSLIIDT